jgi:cysteine desulfurase
VSSIYLDHNATTPVLPEVREAMMPFLDEMFGNPSSLHSAGARARRALDEARESVAHSLKSSPEEIVFTSGGTEAIYLALSHGLHSPKAVFITTALEHQSVLKTCEAFKKQDKNIELLSVDVLGRLSLEVCREAITEKTAMLSVMHANNEIGNLYPIAALGALCREKGVCFHVDAVQSLGKVPIDLFKLPVDLMSFSAHKIYGPKGVGALFVRKGLKLNPWLRGGSQERERRAGTENLPGIVGFAKALEIAVRDLEAESVRLNRLRNALEQGLQKRIPDIRIHGDMENRLSNTTNISFQGLKNDLLLIALDREGMLVSAGSACASGALKPSHVLLAMGIPLEEARGSLRFSLGRSTSDDDIKKALEIIPQVVERLRKN